MMDDTEKHNCSSLEKGSNQPLIELKNICFWRGTKEILHNVNLTINEGDFIAITGPNGGGKTTLLKIILKLIKPQNGTVIYFRSQTMSDRMFVGYLPQKNMIDSHFPLSVKDVISSGLLSDNKMSKDEKNKLADQMVRTLGLEAKANHPIGELSGGQMQRVLIGRALISSPEILILDEPLSYLDKFFENKIYEILKEIAPRTTIVLVSHELNEISSIANRHIIVDHTLRACPSGKHLVHYDCEG